MYYKFLKQNTIPIVCSADHEGEGGLCNIFPEDKFFKLLTPYAYELRLSRKKARLGNTRNKMFNHEPETERKVAS